MAGVPNASQLLGAMKKMNASDLHLKAGLPPAYRISGVLKNVNSPPMSGDEIEQCLSPIIPPQRRHIFDETGDLDFATELPDGDRFRVNIFRAGAKMNAAVRRVNSLIPSYEELHIPAIYSKLVDEANEGIVIICGVTGSGKSTTIAAMIEQINSTRHDNIITLEDPIEFQFKAKKSVISRREIGIDLPSYEAGLRYMVRQDPDTVFIGEMRDRNTMTSALQAAETGHLVFGTMHTADTAQSFARVLEFFDREEHAFIRSSLANSLRGICAQRLMPGADAKSPLVPATEVLLNTPTCRELIRKEQDKDLPALIESSENEGMHSFTTSLARLVESDLVFMDTAMQFAPNPEALASRLRGIQSRSVGMIQRSK